MLPVRRALPLLVSLFLAGLAPARARAQVEELEAALEERGLTDDRFVATTVFSWTSEAQAAELARTRRLLTLGPEGGRSRSPYQRALDEVAADPRALAGDAALARLLTASPELRARRYAWVSPHGTAIPRGRRSYGPVLLSITLAEDALFARFAPGERPSFRVVDARGAAVDPSVAIASPSRLASVLHIRADDPHGPYRELVVHGGASSRSVRCWAMGTPAVRARIEADRAMISRLRRVARPRRALPLAPFWSVRTVGEGDGRWTARWARTMPFDTSRHRLAAAALMELERVLAARVRQRTTPVEECAAPP